MSCTVIFGIAIVNSKTACDCRKKYEIANRESYRKVLVLHCHKVSFMVLDIKHLEFCTVKTISRQLYTCFREIIVFIRNSLKYISKYILQ
jgi:hypothetical protein